MKLLYYNESTGSSLHYKAENALRLQLIVNRVYTAVSELLHTLITNEHSIC